MSVQVSYKKQTIFGIMGLLVIFLVVEGIANVWWITQITCEFENNEIFSSMDAEKKRQLCVDLYEVKTSGNELLPNQSLDTININNHGFRGDEFSEIKPSDTYRIFMLGGSTMFGTGATDDTTTIPGYVQQFSKNNSPSYNFQVINAGIQGADSFSELALINNKIIDMSPDLVIIYDGWNDLRSNHSDKDVLDNWNSICNLGQKNNFDVIISLQPIAGFGEKNLSPRELDYSQIGKDYYGNPLIDSIGLYNKYADNLDNLQECVGIDLRSVFDNESIPIYWDQGHVSDNGNQIVANSLNSIISQVIPFEITSNNVTDKIDINSYDNIRFENPIFLLISNYKTPVMLTEIFSFNQFSQNQNILELENSDIPKSHLNFIYETQPIAYDAYEIAVKVELSSIKNEKFNNKQFTFTTLNKNDNSKFSNVTYFITIIQNQNVILRDYFFVENESFRLELIPNNSDNIEILGDRQYDHNAIIVKNNSPVQLTGKLLDSNEPYELLIDIRTISDPSEWIFSLNEFSLDVSFVEDL